MPSRPKKKGYERNLSGTLLYLEELEYRGTMTNSSNRIKLTLLNIKLLRHVHLSSQ